MWPRTYRSCERMAKILRGKGYSDKEAWEIVNAIWKDTREGDDLKRRAEMVMSKADWDKMMGGD